MSLRIFHLVSYPLYSGPLPPTVGLAVAQRELGHTVWLAFDTKRGDFDGYEEAAAERVAAAELHSPLALTLSTKSSPLELWRDARALRAYLRAGHVDVLHVHMSHDHTLAAMVGSAAPRVARVRTVHAARSLEPRLGQRWLTRQAQAWIVRSEAHRARLLSEVHVPAERVALIPAGIDARAFHPASAEERAAGRARFGVPAAAPLLGHVALLAGRGQEELLAAVRELARPELHVLFVGRGEHEAPLRDMAWAMGLGERVHFAGYLKGAELLGAYAAMDAAFLAQAGNDASARAALEAMACGLPVLAVRQDALAELVTPALGYPIARRSGAVIAEALGSWLADLGEGRRRGDVAREAVLRERSFTLEAQRTVALYERALAAL